MPFAFGEEQQAFSESANDVLRRHCPMSYVRAVRDGAADWQELWRRLVDLDLPALLVPEEHGGLGLTAVDMVAILEVAGRFAPPVPLASTIGGFTPLVVAAAQNPQAAADILPGVLEGMPCGYVPSVACPDTGGVSASLKGARLTANCDVVPDAGRVRLLAVPVADAGGDAVRLLVASPKELGISVDTGIDPSSSVGRLDVQDHEVSDALILQGDPRAAVPLAWIAASAELVGVASELLDRAVEHARERSQFGRAIGSFQAIKHRLVDTLVWIERARSLTRYAALADRDDREDRVAAAHDAKAAASEAAEIAARAAVQIHGGLGITEEDDVSLLYLRARQLSMVLGGADAHYHCGCRQATAVTAD